MSSAATMKSPSHTHSHKHSSSRSSRPSTTPRGPPGPHSVGQPMPPLLTPNACSPHAIKAAKSQSPSYFGLVVGTDESIPADSNPGHHARQNWIFPDYSSQSTASTAQHIAVESNPEFELFRRQSEKGLGGFSLGSSLQPLSRPTSSRANTTPFKAAKAPIDSPMSPGTKKPVLERARTSAQGKTLDASRLDHKNIFDIPRQHSPAPMTPRHSVFDHQHARLSLPVNEFAAPANGKTQRSETLPPSAKDHEPNLVNPMLVADLLHKPDNVLILDLRVYQQYAAARIRGSLNLCIPTTLLKRPSFTIQKLADTFSSDTDKANFERWRRCEYIVVYDANSVQAKEAVTCFNVLKKFSSEGWKGRGLVVKGGFLAFARQEPDKVDQGAINSAKKSNQPFSISPPDPDVLPVAGGCTMPTTQNAANPFFGNIRQNMDLLDGVGQIPIQRPSNMTESSERALPAWLYKASRSSDEGKLVSGKFLSIEKLEQKRMQDALSTKVSYGTPTAESPRHVQVAGIEKGSKNRYNNIFPYDHTRVRLQGVSKGDCDYVNASHVKADYSNRHYIATQAPIPSTFNDFWRVVWEQDVRVIVMLTAEAEGGQVKSHPYWKTGEYGPLKVKTLSERKVSLERGPALKSPAPTTRPSLGQRRSTTNQLRGDKELDQAQSPTSASPSATVRTFSISHSAFPFRPMREITQVQYTQWPDFGAPASPSVILGLIEIVDKYIRGSSSPSGVHGLEEPAPERERPTIVHCSAGCGRTGTYCTIDSVIDMLKRQMLEHAQCHDQDRMEVDHEAWIDRDDEDLVARTVDNFRHQRLSMVQNLRQFVLCYESILQWVVGQQADAATVDRMKETRKSYQG